MRNNYTSDLIIGDYFQWDAIDRYVTGTSNSTYGTGDAATQTWCKGCPSADECLEILSYPHYWDDGTGENTASYTMGDGNVTHNGVWIVKPSARTGTKTFSPSLNNSIGYSGTVSGTNNTNLDIRTNTNFVFLPAAGYYTNNDVKNLLKGGLYCKYWTSTTSTNAASYCLYATSTEITITTEFARSNGYLSWQFPNAQ